MRVIGCRWKPQAADFRLQKQSAHLGSISTQLPTPTSQQLLNLVVIVYRPGAGSCPRNLRWDSLFTFSKGVPVFWYRPFQSSVTAPPIAEEPHFCCFHLRFGLTLASPPGRGRVLCPNFLRFWRGRCALTNKVRVLSTNTCGPA